MKVGNTVITPDGTGKILKVNPVQNFVKVQ